MKASKGTSELLAELATIGEDPRGGVTRLLYDSAWRQAQQAVARMMADAGLAVAIDEVGNVYGTLAGSDAAASHVLTGSHIDTVPCGGHYDGALGIAAGIAALSQLQLQHGQPRRTLEVVSFCEEEGSRFPLAYWGSGNVTGSKRFDGALAAKDSEGISLREAMIGAGFEPDAHRRSKRTDIGMYIELHIEQGEVMERAQCDIGVVDAICGQRRYFVAIEGRSGHAGTTPMAIREDALAAGAEMLVWLRQAAVEQGDGLVATVGKMDVSPNIANVIPGKVRFSVDIRHRDEAVITAFCERTFEAFNEAAARHSCGMTMSCWLNERPAPMDAAIQERIARIADWKGYSHMTLSSGAGHDAGLFAPHCACGMIFIPSQGGISHSPLEYTAPEAIARGTELLTELLYQLAYVEESHEEI
ncbi:Zn-dependent hydrolase [Paenibacillus lignilyticus]|uniref:Zn-dependent hydrolase n=1 Tax=Paenibacillus lignilyticus TaxID=1172615 RepID=A0ABS5C7W0_9BACL|nr:Zn-dependent hydrolase [Paenibacillus lignilyticus]MBP3963795.1 Zn-dependent hydrolase [Paenibacillus lignilyticus]